MSLQISGVSAGGAVDRAHDRHANRQERREAYRALGSAIESNDLEAAKKAYVELAEHAPGKASQYGGTAAADLGKALKSGDMDAAKTAFNDMLRSRAIDAKQSRQTVEPVPVTTPAVDSTGTVGTQVNTVV